MTKTDQTTAPLYLGIECGGTRSIALLSDATGKQVVRTEAGSANIKLLSDPQLHAHFRKINSLLKNPRGVVALAIGMAGARTETDRQRILAAADKVWPDIPCYATNDLETALAAAESEGEPLPRVLILSGTGSCCFGKTADGKKTAKVGGWGHLLGDKGSGYEIGLRTLKALVFYYDRDGVWPALGQKILRSLELNTPNELIGWVQNASKSDVASLAVEVFNAWARKDKIATDIITAAAESLATDGADCARHLVKPGTGVQFILAGSLPLKQPKFAAEIERVVLKSWPKGVVTPLKRESVWGAIELAKKHFAEIGAVPAKVRVVKHENAWVLEKIPATNGGLPMTEQRNPRSVNLDQLPVSQMIELMVSEDKRIPDAILAERSKIEQAIKYITRSFKTGGRLFYVGAGSSGRLGVLDASECPPTFRTPPELVQGIIAGGQMALWRAVEGAEDDALAGAEAVQFNSISKKDVVIGIAASGRTPFVWGALLEAKKRGAITVLLCFNPDLVVAAKNRPNIIIAPKVGPEILTGSTRLKAGTATKLILNMLTTLSMVKLGKVISNLMVDLNPSNIKLRDRAVRIVRDITGADEEKAKAELEKANWVIKEACRQLRLKGYSARPGIMAPTGNGQARVSA